MIEIHKLEDLSESCLVTRIRLLVLEWDVHKSPTVLAQDPLPA